ncbi:MAG: DnaJ domain-containing protein [Vicinamibacteria bacterium]
MSYYEILGLSPDASDTDIKAAYRRLALRYHPDSGNPGDVARFREIQEAYETLSDSERRRAYDRVRTRTAPVSWTGGYETPIQPFREVFPRTRTRPNVELDIVLTEEEARRGGEVRLEVRSELECGHCRGSGFGFFGWCTACCGEGSLGSYERLTFQIPAGAESGGVILARRRDGSSVRAWVRVTY